MAAAPKKLTTADTTAAVDAFMATLANPHKSLIESIRRGILACHPSIEEGIKWNAPSFRTTEYFATTNLREKNGVGVILHLGAKVRDPAIGMRNLADAQSLLRWLAKDRAMVVFSDAADFSSKQVAFKVIIRNWIDHVV